MRDARLYQIGSLSNYLDAENFGLLLNRANEKYNQAIWKRYASWGVPTDDREWKQGTKETPILVRASVLGTNSPKPHRNTIGWSMYGGTLPKIGHGFEINQDDMIELRKVAKLSDLTFGQAMTDCFVQNSGNMLGGIHTELNHMTLQAMSTGEISQAFVDGIAYDFKYPIPEENFTAPAVDWFVWDTSSATHKLVANESADVVEDLLTLQEYYNDQLSLGLDHWKVSKKLLRMILTHPSVTSAYKAAKNYYNPENVVTLRSQVLAWLNDEMGIWPFEEIDNKSAHEEDGKAVADAPAFDEHNLVASTTAFRPFEMKCMNSILKDRMAMGGKTAADLYSLVEDRIVVLNSWEERPNLLNIVDCELFAAPVFNNVRAHGIVTVWKDEE